jgi:hypothetical protein
VALEDVAFAQVLPGTVPVTTETISARPLWIDDCCTMVCSQVVAIASGNPFNPSHTAISTSATPRVLQLDEHLQPEAGALAAAPPAQIPRMSRSPAVVTPMTT